MRGSFIGAMASCEMGIVHFWHSPVRVLHVDYILHDIDQMKQIRKKNIGIKINKMLRKKLRKKEEQNEEREGRRGKRKVENYKNLPYEGCSGSG